MGTTRKYFAVGSLALSLIFGLSSCETTKTQTPEPEPDKTTTQVKPKKKPPTKPNDTDTTPGNVTPAPEPGTDDPVDKPADPGDGTEEGTSDTTPDPEPVAEDYKYGLPVPGRPGMIRSPHNPDAGLIDARGLKPGTKIRCPFTSKVIKVP